MSINIFNRLGSSISVLLVSGSVLLATGCIGSPSRVVPPNYSAGAGADAVAAYDKDGDDAIGKDELKQVPALRESIKQVDSNGDGRITASEIDDRVASWKDAGIGEMTVTCRVVLDGSPLEGAQVEFEPESFLGSSVKPASATTGPNGDASVSMAKEDLADPRYTGVACGWYKIRVTTDGQKIPARYNTETTLGCEVAMNAHWSGADTIVLDLKSK